MKRAQLARIVEEAADRADASDVLRVKLVAAVTDLRVQRVGVGRFGHALNDVHAPYCPLSLALGRAARVAEEWDFVHYFDKLGPQTEPLIEVEDPIGVRIRRKLGLI